MTSRRGVGRAVVRGAGAAEAETRPLWALGCPWTPSSQRLTAPGKGAGGSEAGGPPFLPRDDRGSCTGFPKGWPQGCLPDRQTANAVACTLSFQKE